MMSTIVYSIGSVADVAGDGSLRRRYWTRSGGCNYDRQLRRRRRVGVAGGRGADRGPPSPPRRPEPPFLPGGLAATTLTVAVARSFDETGSGSGPDTTPAVVSWPAAVGVKTSATVADALE